MGELLEHLFNIISVICGTHAHTSAYQPASGLRIAFELKKVISRQDHYQALLSNELSGRLNPIVIVTDLNEHYCMNSLNCASRLLGPSCPPRN